MIRHQDCWPVLKHHERICKPLVPKETRGRALSLMLQQMHMDSRHDHLQDFGVLEPVDFIQRRVAYTPKYSLKRKKSGKISPALQAKTPSILKPVPIFHRPPSCPWAVLPVSQEIQCVHAVEEASKVHISNPEVQGGGKSEGESTYDSGCAESVLLGSWLKAQP